MTQKKKIVLLSDHPLVPSGVGTQAKYLIEGLLKTGRYQFFCLGGAVEHPNYNLQKVEPYGDDWKILPVQGYGDKSLLRQVLVAEKPDAVLLFTDPRFFTWVWEMEDEVRRVCPLLYWHVWDNDPIPRFNKIFYDSTDFIGAISLKTYGILQEIIGKDSEKFAYIPHGVPSDIFKPLPEEVVQEQKKKLLGPHGDKRFIVFWNNRNARRKQTGDVIASFASFAERIGKSKTALMMHTNPDDPEGQNITALAREFKVDSNLIISSERLPPDQLNMFYNICDVTINIASNEGFGLGTLESLCAGTPIIVHMTGGLQFQIGDWWRSVKDFSDQERLTSVAKSLYNKKGNTNWWGIPIFSASRSCTGSQQIPYIYDDRVNHDDVVSALMSMCGRPRELRKSIGLSARNWVLSEQFNIDTMIHKWDEAITKTTTAFSKNPYTGARSVSL